MSAGTIRFSPLVRYVTDARGGAVRGALAQGRRPAGGSHLVPCSFGKDTKGKQRLVIPDLDGVAHEYLIEVIVRQMLRRVQVTDAGHTRFITGEQAERSDLLDESDKVMKEEGKQGATYEHMPLGITKASLSAPTRSSPRRRSRRRRAC